MIDSDEIFKTIEKRRDELGLSQSEVSVRAFNRNDTSAIQNIKRGASPSAKKLAALSKALDLEFYFGPPRSVSQPVVNGFAEAAAKIIEPSIDGSPEALRIGYLPIPFGQADPKHVGAAPIAIARSWLDDRGLQPDNLYFYVVPDDSMAPALPKGALALINTRAGHVGHFIWGYVEGGKLAFARMSWPDKDQLMISSDDHAKPPVLKTGKQVQSINILGKVIWSGQEVPAS